MVIIEVSTHRIRDKHDIRRDKTISNTLQHNGVTEKGNQTIIKKYKYMLKMANLPKPF